MLTFLCLASIGGVLAGMLHGPLADTGDRLWPLAWAAWPVVAWLVLIKRPGNRVGLACLAIAVAQGVAFGLQSMVLDVEPAVAAWLELTYTVLGVVPWLAIIWTLVVFPTGVYQGRFERIIGYAIILVFVWAFVGFLVSTDPLIDTGLENPMAVEELAAVAAITNESGFMLVIALGIAAIASVIARGRKSQGLEKQQYRWLLWGGNAFVVVTVIGQLVPEGSSAELLWLLGGSAIPISIGVAVVRYRLYEIDRIISRTVAYLLVVGALTVVYIGGVTLLSTVLPPEDEVVVAASTLAVAALFNPLRRRILSAVDRRFNRSRYDAELIIDSFAGSLRNEIDPVRVRSQLVGVVAGAMQPSRVSVWMASDEAAQTPHPRPNTEVRLPAS